MIKKWLAIYAIPLLVMGTSASLWFCVMHWYAEAPTPMALAYSTGMFVFMYVMFEIIRS